MTENKPYVRGIILFMSLTILHASTVLQSPQCQNLNAASMKCKWKPYPEYDNLILFYKKNSDPKHKTCLYNCSKIQEETGDDGEIYQFCEFFEGSLYDQYELFLADSSRCSEVEKDCWNCDGEIGEKEEFNCSPENVVLTEAPRDLRFERNSTLKWSSPEKDDSMLDFVMIQYGVLYKLMYRRVGCSNASDRPLNHTWKVWYEGNKTAYSPRNMVPGCQYEAKVHAWLHNKEAWEYPKNQQWGPSSKSIQFVVPILQPLDTQESERTTNSSLIGSDQNPHPSESRAAFRRDMLIGFSTIALLLLIVCLVVFRKRFPTKTPVPKPFLMIPLDELKANFNSHWDNSREPEATAFLPDIVSRVMQENNHIFKPIPLMKEKSNAFQLLIENGNEATETVHQPGRNLILRSNNTNSERNRLLNNEEIVPTSPSTLEENEDSLESDHHAFEKDALEPTDINVDPLLTFPNSTKQLLKLTAQSLAELPVDNSQEVMSSEVILGLPNEHKLECTHEHSHGQVDPDSLSPQTTSSGFAEYMDYVSDTFRAPSSTGRVAFFPDDENFDTRNFSDGIPTYLEQISQEESIACCYHGNKDDNNSVAYSSLPSVTGEYVAECCNEQDLIFKMLTRSSCSSCKKRFVVKHHPSYEHKRKSVGELPFDFSSVNPNFSKNRRNNSSTDALSLDSGCSPDLVVSP